MSNALKAAVGALMKVPKSDEQILQLSGFRGLKVSQMEPPLLELSRAGRLFSAKTTAVASARAPVQDVPTTTANWCLFNPSNNPRCLVILQAAAYLGSGTAPTGISLIGGTTAGPLATALTGNAAGHATASTRGQQPSSRAFLGVGTTIPSGAAQYRVLAALETTADTSPGAGVVAPFIWGVDIVPPGFGFALDVLSGAGTAAKYSVDILYAELELDLD